MNVLPGLVGATGQQPTVNYGGVKPGVCTVVQDLRNIQTSRRVWNSIFWIKLPAASQKHRATLLFGLEPNVAMSVLHLHILQTNTPRAS